MSRNSVLTAAAGVLFLALPAASPGDVNRLYDEYRGIGTIRACAHSEAELRDGLAQIPADVRAYDPGFADALNSALEQRAASCEGAGTPGEPEGGRLASDGSPGPAVLQPPPAIAETRADDGDDGRLQAALIAAAVLCGGIAALLVAGGRRRRG